jgi:hypothetical protein
MANRDQSDHVTGGGRTQNYFPLNCHALNIISLKTNYSNLRFCDITQSCQLNDTLQPPNCLQLLPSRITANSFFTNTTTQCNVRSALKITVINQTPINAHKQAPSQTLKVTLLILSFVLTASVMRWRPPFVHLPLHITFPSGQYITDHTLE